MTYEQERTSVERQVGDDSTPAESPASPQHEATSRVVELRERASYKPSGATIAGRVVVVVFGIIQVLLVARILLDAFGALQSNGVVATVHGVTQAMVTPFVGMFSANTLRPDGTVMDVPAIMALIAVTVLEIILLAIVRIPRRGERI